MGANINVGNFQFILQCMGYEISDVKLSLCSVLNKLEYHISLFVYFKEKLSIIDASLEDVHTFENLLDELKEEVLNTNKKVSLLEEKTSVFSSLLEQNEGTHNQTIKMKTELLDYDKESEGDCYRKEVGMEDIGMKSDMLHEEDVKQTLVPIIQLSENRFEKILTQKASSGSQNLHNNEGLSLEKCGVEASQGDEKNANHAVMKNVKEEKKENSKMWKLTCQICKASFLSRGCYFEHRKTHTASELRLLSPKNKNNVSIDFDKITNHDGSVTYNCKICGKSFGVKTYIERHLLTHTGDRPYQCSSCSKCYNDSSHLRRHIYNSHCNTLFTGGSGGRRDF